MLSLLAVERGAAASRVFKYNPGDCWKRLSFYDCERNLIVDEKLLPTLPIGLDIVSSKRFHQFYRGVFPCLLTV